MTSPQLFNYKNKYNKITRIPFNPRVRLFDIKGVKVFSPCNKN